MAFIDITLISHDHYNHLNHNTIEYLHNNNKAKYYRVPLCVGEWLKDQFKNTKEKIHEQDWQKVIDIKYNRCNINSTKTNVNNRNKSYNIFISNTLTKRWYQTIVITITITTKIIVIKFPITDQERNK